MDKQILKLLAHEIPSQLDYLIKLWLTEQDSCSTEQLSYVKGWCGYKWLSTQRAVSCQSRHCR